MKIGREALALTHAVAPQPAPHRQSVHFRLTRSAAARRRTSADVEIVQSVAERAGGRAAMPMSGTGFSVVAASSDDGVTIDHARHRRADRLLRGCHHGLLTAAVARAVRLEAGGKKADPIQAGGPCRPLMMVM